MFSFLCCFTLLVLELSAKYHSKEDKQFCLPTEHVDNFTLPVSSDYYSDVKLASSSLGISVEHKAKLMIYMVDLSEKFNFGLGGRGEFCTLEKKFYRYLKEHPEYTTRTAAEADFIYIPLFPSCQKMRRVSTNLFQDARDTLKKMDIWRDSGYNHVYFLGWSFWMITIMRSGRKKLDKISSTFLTQELRKISKKEYTDHLWDWNRHVIIPYPSRLIVPTMLVELDRPIFMTFIGASDFPWRRKSLDALQSFQRDQRPDLKLAIQTVCEKDRRSIRRRKR
jgi:hypothetical protein